MHFQGAWRPYSHELWLNFVQRSYLKEVRIGGRTFKYMYFMGRWRRFNAALWGGFWSRIQKLSAGPVTKLQKVGGKTMKYMYYQGRWVLYNSRLWKQWVMLNGGGGLSSSSASGGGMASSSSSSSGGSSSSSSSSGSSSSSSSSSSSRSGKWNHWKCDRKGRCVRTSTRTVVRTVSGTRTYGRSRIVRRFGTKTTVIRQ